MTAVPSTMLSLGRRIGGLLVLPSLLFLSALMLAGCIVERPYTTERQASPFALTLTDEAPVAIRDLTLTFHRSSLPDSVTVKTELRIDDPDPRVRIILIDDAAAIAPYSMGAGSPSAELGSFQFCPPEPGSQFGAADECTRTVRVVFELDSPKRGEALAISGNVESAVGYSAKEQDIPQAVSVTGLESGIEAGRAAIRRASLSGGPIVLDAAHPIALQRIRLTLEPGGSAADLRNLAAGAAMTLELDSENGGQVGLSFYSADRSDEEPFSVRSSYSSADRTFHPMESFSGCRAGEVCDVDLVARFALQGDAAGSQTVRWGLEALLVRYDGGLPDDLRVTAEQDPIQVIPDGAPVLSRTYSGRLELNQANPNERAETEFTVLVERLRPEKAGDVAERPGVAILTFSAVERDGPATRDPAPLLLIVQNTQTDGQSTYSVENVILARPEFSADGQARSVVLQLLADCKGDGPCEVGHRLTLLQGYGKTVSKPVLLDWTLEVRATSFDTAAFASAAEVVFEPVDRP